MATTTMSDRPPANVLSGPHLSHYMNASFPKDTTPQLKTAYDAVALASHAAMLSIGARLIGLGEEHRVEAHSDPDQPQPLPAEWSAQPGSYAFRYKHGQSSMEFLLKINRMGSKAVIMGMGLGDDRTCSFDIKVADYVSESNLPLTLSSELSQQEAEKKVVDVFISIGRLSDLGVLMRVNILQKLLPSLQKEGYEESAASTSSSRAREPPGRERERDTPTHDPLREERDPPARPFPLHDPLAMPHMPGRRPMPEPMPGFEDEFEMQRPGGMLPGYGGGGGFGRLGERDLYPQGLGPNDPIRGGLGPGLGGGRFGGGGMHPTFDDPLFAGQGQGGRYDPRNPPGSRFDPVGPGMPGAHPRGAGMGGRPPNPFGGFGDGDFI